MRQLITYIPKAPQGGNQFGSVGRVSGIPLAGQTQDTVTPAIIARAGAQLGQGIAHYGEAQERQQAVTLALDTMQQAEKDYSAFENDYMQKKRRKDAETAPQDFEQWMQTAGAKYGEQLQSNPLAASLFNQQWGRRSIDAVRQGGHYARQQNELWRGEVADGEAATLMQQAAQVDDPAQIANMRSAYKTKLQEMFPGSDLTATLAKVDQRLASNLIGRAIAQDNFGKAQALATQFRGELGDSYDETLQHIKNSSRSAASYYDAQNEKSQRLAAANTARQLVTTFGGDSEKAIAHINANSKDEQQRQRMLSAYLTQRNLDDAAAQQIKQEKTIGTQRDIQSRIEAAGSDPAALNTIVAEAAPEHKQFALAHAEQALGKQPPAFSEPQAWTEANNAILNGERYEVVVGRYAGRLAKTDMAELKTLAGKEDKQNEKEWKSYFDRIWSASSHARISDTADRNQNKNQLEYEVTRRLRGVTDSQKARDIIFSLVHDRKAPGIFGWTFGGSTVSSTDSAAYDKPENLKFVIPDDARERIVNDLKKQGDANPSDEKIYKAFVTHRTYYGY